MATKELLKLGRLTAGSGGGFEIFPGGTDDNGFIRVNATFQSADTTVTINNDITNYYGASYIRPGQILRVTGVGYTDNITTIVSVAGDFSSLVVADAPNSNKTGTTVIRPQKGSAFVQSGSLVRPNGYPTWNFTLVTGSNDTEYNNDFEKWAIYTQMALTSSETSNVTSVYGIYEIFDVTNRITNTLASFYVTASVDYPEPDAFCPFKTGASIGISELTLTQSVAQIFHGGDIGVLEGLGFAASQDQILTYISQNQGFPFTGSAQITGSLGITGSFELEKGAAETDFFLIKSASFTPLKLNSDGVAVFGGFSSLPTAVEGGLAYSASNFYAGIE